MSADRHYDRNDKRAEHFATENRRLTRTIGTPNTRARAIAMGVPGRQDDYDRTVNTWIE